MAQPRRNRDDRRRKGARNPGARTRGSRQGRWEASDQHHSLEALDQLAAHLAGGGDPAEGDPLHVILTAHAARQLEVLGRPARRALVALGEMSHDEIRWSAEQMPPQQGREVWMLWAGTVRVLFDIEEDDLTVQGFGLRPGW